MKIKALLPFLAITVLPCIGRANDKTLIYILCDYTGSINSAKTGIMTNLKSLCNQVPQENDTEINLFGVSAENAPTILYSLKLPAITGNWGNNRKLDSLKRRVKLLNFIEAAESGFVKLSKSKSCIMKSMELLASNLHASIGYKKQYLIVFSDWMEVCNYNNQFFDFDHGQAKQAVGWIRRYHPEIPAFSGLPKLTIGVFRSSTAEGSLTEVLKFWAQWFIANGYSKPLYFPTVVTDNWFY